MNVHKYLQRIDIDQSLQIDYDTLAHLQLQHLLRIPFENLDVMNHIPIPLDVETYFKKIVEHNRGGFCYELNGLFHWLLQQLGFNCHLVAGTVIRPDGSPAMADSHATQIVKLDQLYLVDVGFGDSCRVPLPLNGAVRKDVSGAYRIIELDDGLFELQKQSEHKWRAKLQFRLTPKNLIDFHDGCKYNQTSPHSHFTQKLLVTIPTEHGRITLSGNHLTFTKNGEKHVEVIQTEELAIVLQQYFGINLNFNHEEKQ